MKTTNLIQLAKTKKSQQSPLIALRIHQAGMTLIEIMIALLIGAFLIGGILEIFINSRQTYRMQEGLSRLQENGRFALDFLADDIRMAGFIGCNNNASLTNTTTPLLTPNTLNTPTAFLYDFSKAIEGFESTSTSAWTPTINAAISSPQGGSDVITIRRAADQGFTVITQASVTDGLTLDSSATTTNLQTVGFLNSSGTNNCTIAVVNNCSSASVFQVSSITGSVLSHSTGSGCTPDNLTNSLAATYVGGQIFPINTISYYVSTNPSNNLSIYRKVGSSSAQELVEGIEQMQILYGEDTDQDGAPNYYVTANNVVNMVNVVSIRISLLAVTVDDNLASQPLTYNYNGTNVTPTDNKIRRVFNTTIAVRN